MSFTHAFSKHKNWAFSWQDCQSSRIRENGSRLEENRTKSYQESAVVLHVLRLRRSNLSGLDCAPNAERLEGISIGLEELRIELHPMQTQGMQEALKNIHTQEH